MDIAFYAALDKWVTLLAEQQKLREAGQPLLTDAELQQRWEEIFRFPPRLKTGFASSMVWGWKCFRFRHPYLSIVAPAAAALGVLNGIFSVLAPH